MIVEGPGSQTQIPSHGLMSPENLQVLREKEGKLKVVSSPASLRWERERVPCFGAPGRRGKMNPQQSAES